MPEWIVVHPVESGLRLLIASCVVQSLVIVGIALRLLSRYLSGAKLGWDDSLALFAFVCSMGQTTLFGLLVFGGLGHHADTVPISNQYSIPKILFCYEILHILSLNTAKLSALSFYIKLFANKTMETITKLVKGFIFVFMIGLLFWQFLFCRPLWRMFQWGGLENCGDRKPLYLTICIFSIFSDIILLALPMPSIWTLKMSRGTKIRLSLLFASGLFTTAVSITRLAIIVGINYRHDFSFYSVSATYLADLEPHLTILCVSLPMIYSLYAKFIKPKHKRNNNTSGRRVGKRTIGMSLSHRYDKKRTFNTLQETEHDPFELEYIYGSRGHVGYNVSVDNGRPLQVPSPTMKPGRVARDVGSSRGSDEALVLETREGGNIPSGIIVSKKWSVSRT
ncbi:hypothetical protein F4809DRAFT_630246 [Biscogniauxia mediterranea]|nr:hypothetical protein F4809DRAFT_630246 [Biscogniauxia mediterranea]